MSHSLNCTHVLGVQVGGGGGGVCSETFREVVEGGGVGGGA